MLVLIIITYIYHVLINTLEQRCERLTIPFSLQSLKTEGFGTSPKWTHSSQKASGNATFCNRSTLVWNSSPYSEVLQHNDEQLIHVVKWLEGITLSMQIV